MSTEFVRRLKQENTRLQEENDLLREENQNLRRYMLALEELQRATRQIISETNLLSLLDQILENARSVLRAEDGSIALLDEETDELVFVLVHGNIRDKLEGYRLKRDTGIAGWVASHRQHLIVNNAHQDWRFSRQVDNTFGFFTRSILCVPMITGDKLIGVIQLLNKQNEADFVETDATLLFILAQVAATALEEMRIRLEAEEAAAAAATI